MSATLTTCSKIRLSFKCVQLILACICIGLFSNIGIMHHSESTLMAITFGGFIIILAGVILGFLTAERCPKKVDLLFTLVGLAMFIAAGSVAISGFNKLKSYHAIHLNPHVGHANAGHHVATGNVRENNYEMSNEGNDGHTESNEEIPNEGIMTTVVDVKLLKKTINTGLAMGSIAIINGGFFLFDAVLSYKDVNEYTPHQ